MGQQRASVQNMVLTCIVFKFIALDGDYAMQRNSQHTAHIKFGYERTLLAAVNGNQRPKQLI